MTLPRPLRYRGVPGTMRASSPTWVVATRGLRSAAGLPRRTMCAPTWVAATRGLRLAAGLPGRTMCAPTWVAVARGLRLAAGLSGRTMCAPTWVAATQGLRLAAGFTRSVGAGFIPPAGVCAAAGSGACRGLQPPSAAVMPQFSIKALRFPGWRFWRAVRPAIRRWGFRRIFRSIRPQGSGAAFPAGSCACRRSW